MMKDRPIYLVMVKVDDTKIPPFPFMILSSVLKKSGFKVKVIDCYKDDAEKIAESIIKDKPLFVGFSVLTGPPIFYSVMMSRIIKKRSPTIPIVWGGVHASMLPEKTLGDEYIDYIIMGEGEKAISELASCILEGKEPKEVLNLGFKRNGKVILNSKGEFIKDLDSYGMDFDCVDLNDYVYETEHEAEGKKTSLRTMAYYGSRGCPHDCGFCYNLEYNQRRWRCYSAKKVIEDINYLKKKYGVQCIHFWDDNFFVNKSRALEILEGIKCYSNIEIRIDYLTDDLAKQLAELGVLYMLIGGESGSDRILKLMKKGFKRDKLIEGAKILDRYGLNAQYSFILGIPSETEEETYETIDIMWEIKQIHKKASFTVGVYMPYPGTELYRLAQKNGFKEPKTTEEWSKMDRWGNTVSLPWISKHFCLNIRHLFALLSWKNPFVRSWAEFRIRHKIINLTLDLRIIIKTHTFIIRFLSKSKSLFKVR